MLTRFEDWPRWGPSVLSVSSPSAAAGPGVRGSVRTVVGIRLPFVITHWIEGSEWSWRVAGLPATGHRVEPSGDSATLVTFSVAWPAAPYAAVLDAGLDRLRQLAEEG